MGQATAPRVSPLAHSRGGDLDGFTLHASTRAGALDAEGREALIKKRGY
jgi:hypothetical protein